MNKPAHLTEVCEALYKTLVERFGMKSEFLENVEIRERREMSYYITKVKISDAEGGDKFAFISLSKSKGIFALWPAMPSRDGARYEQFFVTDPILKINCHGASANSGEWDEEFGECRREELNLQLGFHDGSLDLTSAGTSRFAAEIIQTALDLSGHLKPGRFFEKQRFPEGIFA